MNSAHRAGWKADGKTQHAALRCPLSRRRPSEVLQAQREVRILFENLTIRRHDSVPAEGRRCSVTPTFLSAPGQPANGAHDGGVAPNG